MALGTVTKVKATVFGDVRATIVDVRPTSGANYTTGGEPFGAAQVPGATGTILAVFQVGSGTALRRVVFLPTTIKLMALAAATDVEIAGSSDLSAAADNVRLLVLSK
jgi:hypothetical protein